MIVINTKLFSFNVGDYILIVWDIASKNYVVYQENKKHLVFLHPDSINDLSLKFSSGKYYDILKFNIL